MGVKQLNNKMIGVLVGGQKINNHHKNIVPFNIQKSNMHVANKHSTKVG
jgi:hypothetical protein